MSPDEFCQARRADDAAHLIGRNGAAVAGHLLAAQAALREVLPESGGNAMDAAIAGAAALAILKPDACGLGSDLFLLFHEARTGKRTRSIIQSFRLM